MVTTVMYNINELPPVCVCVCVCVYVHMVSNVLYSHCVSILIAHEPIIRLLV